MKNALLMNRIVVVHVCSGEQGTVNSPDGYPDPGAHYMRRDIITFYHPSK